MAHACGVAALRRHGFCGGAHVGDRFGGHRQRLGFRHSGGRRGQLRRRQGVGRRHDPGGHGRRIYPLGVYKQPHDCQQYCIGRFQAHYAHLLDQVERQQSVDDVRPRKFVRQCGKNHDGHAGIGECRLSSVLLRTSCGRQYGRGEYVRRARYLDGGRLGSGERRLRRRPLERVDGVGIYRGGDLFRRGERFGRLYSGGRRLCRISRCRTIGL